MASLLSWQLARKIASASLLAAIFPRSGGIHAGLGTVLIYALGTLWYGLFNWFWFWIWREQPLRESL
ncbi:FUSC family membrane protein [Escherichia coli]